MGALTIQTVGELIKANYQQLRAIAPHHIDARRLATIAGICCRQNRQLLQCDKASLAGAFLQSAIVGLEPIPSERMAAIIPRRNKNGKLEANFQPMYGGLMALARNSGRVGRISAEVVRQGETFQWQYGTDAKLVHVRERAAQEADVIAVYALAVIDKDQIDFVVLWPEEIEAIRRRSPAARKDAGPWKTDWEEMAKKTAIIRLMKRQPLSISIARAISLDDLHEVGESQRNDTLISVDAVEVNEATAESDQLKHRLEEAQEKLAMSQCVVCGKGISQDQREQCNGLCQECWDKEGEKLGQ